MDEFVLKPPESYKVKGGADLPLEIVVRRCTTLMDHSSRSTTDRKLPQRTLLEKPGSRSSRRPHQEQLYGECLFPTPDANMALLVLNLSEYIADYNHGGSRPRNFAASIYHQGRYSRVASTVNLHLFRGMQQENPRNQRLLAGPGSTVRWAIVEGF
jgi:hypothetical protein